MKISNITYLSGMPANENYRVQIAEGVTLDLSQEQYNELAVCISEKNEKDILEIKKASDRYFKTIEKNKNFINDLRAVFYSGDEDSDILFRKEIKDIDDESLYTLLEKHADSLGLE
jgi:parvulin-like peptidyl-prolyl isomerase